MWRSKTRLPLWVPGVLVGGALPAPREKRDEEAVLVTYRLPDGLDAARVPGLPGLEDAVDHALQEQGTGELEGIQPGPGTVTVLAYGSDAEKLWSSMEAAVRTFPCRPARATLRYGLVGAPDRIVPL